MKNYKQHYLNPRIYRPIGLGLVLVGIVSLVGFVLKDGFNLDLLRGFSFITLLLGLEFFAFAKEEVEDERTAIIRAMALRRTFKFVLGSILLFLFVDLPSEMPFPIVPLGCAYLLFYVVSFKRALAKDSEWVYDEGPADPSLAYSPTKRALLIALGIAFGLMLSGIVAFVLLNKA